MSQPERLLRRQFLRAAVATGVGVALAPTQSRAVPLTMTPAANETFLQGCYSAFGGCSAAAQALPFQTLVDAAQTLCNISLKTCITSAALMGLVEEAADVAFENIQDAKAWLAAHPEVVVGTLIIVAAVTMVVVAGPGGALILVAA